GLLTRDSVQFGSIAFKQIFFGLIPGLVLLFIASKVDYTLLKRYSFWIFLLAIIINLIIFIPGVGITLNGATRWLHVGSMTLQVSEILKIASVIYFAAWLSSSREHITSFKLGFLPLVAILAIISVILR